MERLLLSLLIAAYIVVPIVFITGWILWRRRPQSNPALGISFIGLCLALLQLCWPLAASWLHF